MEAVTIDMTYKNGHVLMRKSYFSNSLFALKEGSIQDQCSISFSSGRTLSPVLFFDVLLTRGCRIAVDTTKGGALHPQRCVLTPEHGHVSSGFAS